ncbi:class F sortase [[Micrococcus luteus] ATCC 49442]|uniref:class F sortase n=1 Tax=[Micrococcus luteus] ATCC 49442 TaxID=2698727 RepID=UPI001FCB007A|nr:class F sortase [[Micrococcus luteus] ATCC 49442]
MDSDHRQASAGVPAGTDPPVNPKTPPHAGPPKHALPRRRRMFTLKSTLFVLLCGVLAYVAVAFLPQLTAPGPTPPPVIARQTQTAPAAPAPTPSAVPAVDVPTAAVPAGPAASPPQRLVYPAADIDVVIHPLEPSGADQASQTIVPPPTMDGYWLTPYGVPGAGSLNTTYVVGHSWVDRDAPFNRLSSRAAAGDPFTVTTATGELAYVVDSVTTYEKEGLKDSPIWQGSPNRLVLISCYTGDFWGTNVVVVASPAAVVPAR